MKNFKNLFVVLLVVCLAGMLVCCKSASIPPPTASKEVTKSTTTKVVVRDTIFHTPPDSSYYKAWLECIAGKVVFKQPVAFPSNSVTESVVKTPGKYLKPPKVNLHDNILEVDCEAEAQALFAQWRDTYVTENLASVEKIPIPYKLPLTTWEIVQIWCGRIFLGLLIAFIIAVVLRSKKLI